MVTSFRMLVVGLCMFSSDTWKVAFLQSMIQRNTSSVTLGITVLTNMVYRRR
ncbi:hypothetical protein D1872_307260 [compost metagenome]